MQDYKLIKEFGEIEVYRKSFNELAKKTFDISFEEWKNKGHWGSQYIPFAFADGQKVIANVSVNTMDLICSGESIKAVQLGTVMTDSQYRGQGLSRKLMETIFQEYQTRCDFFYLFANDTVLNFYPKFGFRREWEYQSSSQIERYPNKMSVKKLDMDNPTEKSTFTRLINNAVPFAKISMIGNPGLIMFYCDSSMKDDIYYLPELDLAAVVNYKGDTMYLHDIFCEREFDLNTVLDALWTQDIGKIVFGFTPVTNQSYVSELKNDDDSALFVKVNSKFVFGQEMFPVLSHA